MTMLTIKVDMADPLKIDNPTMAELYAVTADEAMEFLTSLEAPGAANCPVCHTNRWACVTPAEYGTIDLPVGFSGGGLTGHAMRCVGLFCDACGYVRMHSLDPIVKWKRQKAG